MKSELNHLVESALADIKAGIYTASAGANRLAALEQSAIEDGASADVVADIKASLDDVAKEIRQLKRAEKVLHEKINRLYPGTPSNPIAYIGT
jgi:MoxR-like ATPase